MTLGKSDLIFKNEQQQAKINRACETEAESFI